MKLYDKIKILLENNPELRNSDKRLMWKIWSDEGLVHNDFDNMQYDISDDDFMSATSPESIRRARQLVVHAHPELGPTSEKVKKERKVKELTKGTFGYHEETVYNLSPDGQESFV